MKHSIGCMLSDVFTLALVFVPLALYLMGFRP